jgi:hypothetical protein
MISDKFVGALAILLIFGAPITAWVISRVLAHQERIEMIRRGMVPPPGPIPGFGSKMPPPVWGQGPIPPPPTGGQQMPYAGYNDYYYAQVQMRKGVRLTLIGFALLVGLGTIGPLSGISYAGPWLLGGLIPFFIGIAQIINAAMNGAQIPGFGAGFGQGQGHANFGPPPPSAPPPSGGAPPPPGPYAWRPGSTPEIERHDK